MRCRTNASSLAKALWAMKPNKIFRTFKMEAVGDAIVITNADDACIVCLQVPAEVIEAGTIAPDLQMLRTLLKGIGDRTVELSLYNETRLRITFTAENGTESTYLLPVFDPDSTLANIAEDLKLEEAQLFAHFHSDKHLKLVLNSMKPLLGKHSHFNSFLFVPEDNHIKVLTIRDPIVGIAEVPAEIPEEVASKQEPLPVPRDITQVPIGSIAKLTRDGQSWVVAISEQGYAVFPTIKPDEKQVISAALRLFNREADTSMKASRFFWRELRRTLSMLRASKNRPKYMSSRPKLEFDFERERCYCWVDEGKPTIVSVFGDFPTLAQQNREIPSVMTFDCELIGEALEFISEPDTIDFLVVSDRVSAMRLRFGSWAVVVASLAQGSDLKTAEQEVSDSGSQITVEI